MDPLFVPGVDPPPEAIESSRWFAFRGAELLVQVVDGKGIVDVPRLADISELGVATARRQYLGTLDGTPCWSAELDPASTVLPGVAFLGLRELHSQIPEPLYALAGRAAQIVAWDRDHRFCGRCGTATEPLTGERARVCPSCGLTSYPRLSPAVIVLIERGDQVLLARNRRFPSGRFGLIAGFVEPGETLEEAVEREVREEAAMELSDVRYFGSQPWPYPHAIMIGFTAAHRAGEPEPDGEELAEAAFFSLDALPLVPPTLSIARSLLDSWAARLGGTIDQP